MAAVVPQKHNVKNSDHLLMLLQSTDKPESRTWTEFTTINDATEEICHLFEEKLKAENPNKRKIVYEIDDLNNYIDGLPDLVCLQYNPKTISYHPKNKDWIKERIFASLKGLAN